ncbi:MipA/OmpV family protein [Acidiferrobacter sp.]|uniref:MipA/OmpV family protein n=1 Tax=Acidiferrobacter sp. TaxID=1872107 RepID=UPI0026251FC3|nr:MipA/OmpV family protein [Acidiferrobacter sp.]
MFASRRGPSWGALRLGALVFWTLALGSGAARAAHYRGGLGFALFLAPAYPGSDSEHLFAYPYPYWEYESPRWHLHHDHLRAQWSRHSPLSVGLGANGSPPAAAGTPDARIGMPGLDPTFALGPDVMVRLPWRPRGWRLWLGARTRYRWAMGPGLRLAPIGSSASAFLESRTPRGRAWPFVVSFGPVFRSRGVNAYFFGVQPAYATAGRPAYAASGGYAGLRLTAAVTTQAGPFDFAIFGRYRNYWGATFAGSPLLKASNTLLFGVAVVWVFIRSGAGS